MSVSDDILQAIDTIVDKKIEKMNLDLTYSGIISAVNSDGYTVEYNGTSINVKTTATDLYKVGDIVKVCIPSGNKRRAYIVVDVEDIKKLFNELNLSLLTLKNSLGTAAYKNISNGWEGVAYIRDDGAMEVGKYIDFHQTSSSTKDYEPRITANSSGLTISNGSWN